MSGMPHDLDAERAVLGSVLLDRRCIAEAAVELAAADFYHPAHGAVFDAMLSLDKASSPIDPVSVADQMRAAGTFDSLTSSGGSDYLLDLLTSVVTTTTTAHHSRSIARKAERRRWISAAREIAATGLADGSDDEFLQGAESALLALTARKRSGGPRAVKSIMGGVVRAIEQRYEKRNDHAITGTATGLVSLDCYTSGWQPSDLVIIAARPSMGKSSLAMQSALEAARAGVPALVFSLEMSAEALVERSIASEGNIDSAQLRSGQIETATWVRLSNSWGRVAGMPLWLDDQSSLTIGEIRSRARRWRMNDAEKHERVLVIVDYIGLVRPDNPNPRMREREVAEVSAGLKAMAKDLRCPVIALSQLNRSCESRADKRPMMSDLRESGSLEQDADVIAFLYRDEWYHEKPIPGQCVKCGPGIAEIIIAKHRNGATGCAHVGWVGKSTKFVNLSNRSPE